MVPWPLGLRPDLEPWMRRSPATAPQVRKLPPIRVGDREIKLGRQRGSRTMPTMQQRPTVPRSPPKVRIPTLRRIIRTLFCGSVLTQFCEPLPT